MVDSVLQKSSYGEVHEPFQPSDRLLTLSAYDRAPATGLHERLAEVPAAVHVPDRDVGAGGAHSEPVQAWVLAPVQFAPPQEGGVQVLVCVPVPQEAEQALQGDQTPLTGVQAALTVKSTVLEQVEEQLSTLTSQCLHVWDH